MKIVLLFLYAHILNAQVFNPTEKIIDSQTHIRCYGYQSKCYTKKDWDLTIYEYLSGISENKLKEKGDKYLFDILDKEISNSAWLEQTIVLAFDHVYNEAGDKQEKNSKYFIPNEFVAQNSRRLHSILFGASIHPYRKDALKQIPIIKNSNAKLVYLNPDLQNFKLDHPRLIALASELKKYNLPLMIDLSQKNNPNIEEVLQTGVTFIATGTWSVGSVGSFKKFNYMTNLLKKYPNLYGSLASYPLQFSWINHFKMIIRSHSWENHLIYGSNYPYEHFSLKSSWRLPSTWEKYEMKFLQNHNKNRRDYNLVLMIALEMSYKDLYKTGHLLLREDEH
jgi:hypothetical protein